MEWLCCGNKLVPNSLEITALKNILVHNLDFCYCLMVHKFKWFQILTTS